MILTLKIIKKSNSGITPDDFKYQETEHINLKNVISISGIKKYKSFSGEFAGYASMMTMTNNDVYYIDRYNYEFIISCIDKLNDE